MRTDVFRPRFCRLVASLGYQLVLTAVIAVAGDDVSPESADPVKEGLAPFRGLTEVNPPAEPAPATKVVIHDVTLVDGRGDVPLEHAVVVVTGSTIAGIGTVGELPVPDGAKIVDGQGKTLLPGLLDPHLHIGSNPKTMSERPALVLRNGVSGARDPGRGIEDYAPVLASGKPLPRLFLTGKHFDQQPHAHPYNALDIQSVEQARRTVDRIVDQGGSGIKVYYRLPVPLIAATCEQADKHGIPVTAHLELIDADKAIAAGIDGIEHVTSCGTAIADPEDAERFRQLVDAKNEARRPERFRLWARIDLEHPRVGQFIDLLVKKGIFLTPTANVFERRPGDRFDSEPFHVDGFETMLKFVGMCHEAGVPIVASSHGTPPVCEEGWAMQHEMRLLHEAGLSPLEVITASTLVPARFFGCGERLGSIEVGKQADLVLYDGKPHEDLNDLWNVARVMQAGRWIGEHPPAFTLSEMNGRDRLIHPNGEPFVALGVNHIAAIARDRQRFEERYEGDWDLFREHLDEQFARWNMNCVGYGAPGQLQQHYPYFATITVAPIEKHRSDPDPESSNGYQFPDPFDPAWAADIEQRMRQLCEQHRDNRLLIGYMWTDTPTWDVIKTRGLRGTDWVSEIRKLPADAPGRRRYAEYLRSIYADRLQDLNDNYGLELASLDGLDEADLSTVAIGRQLVQADDERFLEIIAERFYSVVGAAQRQHDPQHLVFGDRYLIGDHPDGVLREAAKWIDAVAVQPGDLYAPLYPPSTRFAAEEFRRIHEITGKPILICDHAISYPTEEHPRTIFEQAPSEAEAALAIEEFLQAAFGEPYIIGYLKCQYIDRPSGFGRGLRQGLLRADGSERTAILESYARFFNTLSRGR